MRAREEGAGRERELYIALYIYIYIQKSDVLRRVIHTSYMR